MNNSFLNPNPVTAAIPNSQVKAKAIKDAQDMYQVIVKRAERAGVPVPNYEFISLIGKGSFGRVYKCRHLNTGEVLAVKIIDMDDTDYKAEEIQAKDETLKDFKKEVNTLRHLTDSQAKNINRLREAFDFTTQLWIASDYCAGGSLHTLLKPWPTGLQESQIIPAARELAVALKNVHDMGIIHRDVKCANVLITEEGQLQLCDFGIAGIMDREVNNKRMTIIGTPNWMSPELLSSDMTVKQGYGKEVDIWAYGCAVYEMATGHPPYHDIDQKQLMQTLSAPRSALRLEGGNYSQALRDFVAFCLEEKPEDRPTPEEILEHPYIASTTRKYPTSNLAKLLDKFAYWEMQGGQRQSLFAPHGAAPPRLSVFGDQDIDTEDDWNFSTSDSFDQTIARRYSQLQIATQDFAGPEFEAPAQAGLPPIQTEDLTPIERFKKERDDLQANRGGRGLERIFSPSAEPYELHTPIEDDQPLSDLPLRNMAANRGANRETLIDLDTMGLDYEPRFNFEFGDIPTIKANRANRASDDMDDEDAYQFGGQDDDTKRATREWKFPSLAVPAADVKRATMDWSFSTAQPAEPDEPDTVMSLPPTSGALAPGFRPQLKHTATEPIGNFSDFLHPTQPLTSSMTDSPARDSMASMIDLDLGLSDPAEIIRPSTATSATGSTMSDMTTGNPFDLEEDEEQLERDRNRYSHHKQWYSEPGRMAERDYMGDLGHTRGSSLSSTDSELDRMSQIEQSDNMFGFDYNRKLSAHTRGQLLNGLQTSEFQGGNWDKYGADSEPDTQYGPNYQRLAAPRLEDPNFPLSRELRTNGLASRSFSRLRDAATQNSRRNRRELTFPNVLPPHPESLLEDADPELLMVEMDRMLSDLTAGLKATSRLLNTSADGAVSADEDFSARSGDESGMESSFLASADEDGL